MTGILIGILAVILYLIWQNNSLYVTAYTVKDSRIPKAFGGYRVVQISDLHNKRFGTAQSALLNRVKGAKPDMIVITGDLIDRRHPDISIAMEFVSGAVSLAPVYYVPGNHEAGSESYAVLAEQMKNIGATVLENQWTDIESDGQILRLYGVKDRKFNKTESTGESVVLFTRSLAELVGKPDRPYSILLSHRPELLDIYTEYGMDLVFSGHAHGGQIRLPFLGAIVVPDQGFPPKYTEGVYQKDTTRMVVSRGLGSSIIPIRTFNPPEIVVVTLESQI